MVAGDAVDAARGDARAAHEIAAAHDEPDPGADGDRLGDLVGDPVERARVDAEALVAHQGFTRDLQQHSLPAQIRLGFGAHVAFILSVLGFGSRARFTKRKPVPVD